MNGTPAVRTQIAALILLVLLTLPACSAPRAATSRLPALDPAQALAAVRARENRITSLRARFTADTRHEGERRSAEGVLLVKKPDRFRLRLMLPLGLTIFDYLSSDGRTQLALPLEDKVVSGPTQDDRLTFSQADLGQAFLRGANAFPGTCRAGGTDASGIVVRCEGSAGILLRLIHIDAHAGTIRDETSYENGRPRMVIRYSDYRVVGDLPFPYHIALQYPGQHLALDIAIERYEVNPALADDLFQPVQPWAGS